jgi:murein tripeptide amidase MpaA
MNPDGFADSTNVRYCGELTGRTNSHGIDLNRNFPDRFDRQVGDIQVETQVCEPHSEFQLLSSHVWPLLAETIRVNGLYTVRWLFVSILCLNQNWKQLYVVSLSSCFPVLAINLQALMDFILNNNFVLSANLHGGSVVASIPFDGSASRANVNSPTTDDDIFRRVAKAYSENHAFMSNGKVGECKFVCFFC